MPRYARFFRRFHHIFAVHVISNRRKQKSEVKSLTKQNNADTVGWWRSNVERLPFVEQLPLKYTCHVSIFREIYLQCGIYCYQVAILFNGRIFRKNLCCDCVFVVVINNNCLHASFAALLEVSKYRINFKE